MDALAQFGSRLSAGAATEGWGALAPAVNEGWQRAHISREEARKRQLEEERLKRQAANDEFRRLLEDRRLEQADERLQQTDKRMTAAEERSAAERDAREAREEAAAEERRIDNERADARLSLSEQAARRSEASQSAAESRFQTAESRRDRERREDAERDQRREAQYEATRRHAAAKGDYDEGLTDKIPSYESLFDEELVVRGLQPVRGGKKTTPPATPRTTAPAGAPAPPKETPRVPAKPPAAAPPGDAEPAGLRAKAKAAGFDVAAARAAGYTWAEIAAALGG